MMERFGLPVRASQHAGELDQLNAIVHWLMLLLFIGWGLFFLYTIFRFRAKKNPKADYIGVRSHTSSYLEVAVAAVEIVLLVGFSIPLWAYRADTPTFPDAKDAVRVHVMGEQFAWNVHYPGADGISANRISNWSPPKTRWASIETIPTARMTSSWSTT